MHGIDRRHFLTLSMGAAITIGVTGCASSNKTSSSSSASGGSRGGTLTIALDKAPSSLDPADMEQSTSPFAQPAYDALIGVTTDGDLVPALATKWAFTDDQNKVFEITLRDGVTFSDGAKLDADALVANLSHLDGGKSNVASLVNGGTYEKTDDMTVRITWETPHPLAPQALTQRWVAGMLASPKAIKEDAAGLATKTVGAGPYVLDTAQTVTGSKYVYTAREDYWNPDGIHWDSIVINVVENAEQRLNALKTGEADYVAGDLATASSAAGGDIQVLDAPTIVYGLSLLDRDGSLGSPLGDVKVRQAVNLALDREGIAKALLGDYGYATEQTVVPSEAGYVKALDDRYPFDRDKARALLKEAGHADGFDLNVIASTSATAATLAQVLVEQLSAVGINVKLDSRPSADYFEGMTGGTFPAAVIGYGSQPLPMEYDGLFGPDAIFNPLKSKDQTIEDEMQAGLVAKEDEAKTHYEAVMTQLVEEAWFAPAVVAPVFYFASSKLAKIKVSEARPQCPITEIAPAS